MHGVRYIAFLLTVAAFGCNDRSVEPPPIQFERQDDDEVDAGTDTGPPPEPDGICDALPDGMSCSLQNATGVCVRQRCRLVACESGFDDCDAAPGCETGIRTTESCGACNVACAEGEQCQRGPDGFLCNAGTVCPIDRFDLDGDADNGCEWLAEWEDPGTIVPSDLSLEAASWSELPVLAGSRDGSRISTRVGATPDPIVWDDVPSELDARAVAVEDDGEVAMLVWEDAVGRFARDSGEFSYATLVCEEATAPRRFVGASRDYVASQFGVFAVDTAAEACSEALCLEPVFQWGDYLRASYPHAEGGSIDPFATEEVASCSGCLFDALGAPAVPPECAGEKHCRALDFDATVCGTCDATGCPTLDIIDIRETENLLFVVTARGFVALEKPSLRVVARREAAFDPNAATGTLFVGSTSAPTEDGISLLHADGSVSAVAIDLDDRATMPLHPRVGVGGDLDVASVAQFAGTFAIVRDDTVKLVRPDDASARTAFLTMASAPGVQGLAPFAVVATNDGLRVFYATAGQLFTRLIRPAE